MEVHMKGLLACTFGHLFQIYTIWIVILAVVQGKSVDHLATIDYDKIPLAAETGHIIPNDAAHVGAPIRQRRHIDTSMAGQYEFFLNFISPESMGDTEFLFPQPHYHDRFRRAACWGGMGGGGAPGGGTIDDGTAGGGDDIDVLERRRQAARKRQAAQKKKSRSKKKTTSKSKKHFVDDNDDAVEQQQRRRKRQTNEDKLLTQNARSFADNIRFGLKKYKSLANGMKHRKRRETELDDLNNDSTQATKDFSQHARQFVEKVRTAWQNAMESIVKMAQKVKESFSGGNQENPGVEVI